MNIAPLLMYLPIVLFILLIAVLLRIEVRRKGSLRALKEDNRQQYPRGFADYVASSVWRYRSQQALTIILALNIGLQGWVIVRLAEHHNASALGYAALGVIVVLAAVALPLRYLNVIRRLVESEKEITDSGKT